LPSEVLRFHATLDTRTDGSGRFALSPGTAGMFNVQAAMRDDLKAWKAEVAYPGAGSQVDAGNLNLAPTGRIAGRVRSKGGKVVDFANTTVYIPGSSYTAITDKDGTYTISNVPVGQFRLHAYNIDLGDAEIPNADFPENVGVRSNDTTTAPPLELTVVEPAIARIALPGGVDQTDNGGPGAELDIVGKAFGFNRQTRFSVDFNGAPVETPARMSDEVIRVKVPAGAFNGNVTVRVGGLQSNQLYFRVIRGLDFACPANLTVPVDGTFSFGALAVAKDSDQVEVKAAKDSNGKVQYHPPNLLWTVDSPRASITREGVLRGLSKGPVVVHLEAGKLVRTCQMAVADAPPAPSPAPTATGSATPDPSGTSTPIPTANPSASPTPAPTSTPAPTLPPAPSLVSLDPPNGGAGRVITLHGANFGATASAVEIRCGGKSWAKPGLVDSGTIKVAVPAGTTNCYLSVKVGAQPSGALPFTAITAITTSPADRIDLLFGNGLRILATALDSVNATVSFAALDWTSSAPTKITVDEAGGIRA
ncbi:MAG: carboxypeptidase regulatory-like domain-containing protein, partial [Candidatus Sericytochromatia bacterium]|nr:carboxypeptidase regulatory-like domain-containing protein [Candidatus Tanganyikabacteria bacterium]